LFVPFEEPECDKQASRVYTLNRIQAALKKAIAKYERFRIEPLNRLRDGNAAWLTLPWQQIEALCCDLSAG
jgi:hypothetical protein